MPEPDWRAVLVGEGCLTVWEMSGTTALGPARTLPRASLGDLPGPVLVAGLDETAHPVPCAPLQTTTHAAGLPLVAALPMLRQDQPAGLSRGAELAIGGYLCRCPQFDGVLLVLGDETCWAQVSAGEVVSFQTFLTPGLATALAAATPTADAQFDHAVDDTLSRPDRLAQHLSSARAAGSGKELAHLIGAEIASAKPYWLGQSIVVLGTAPISALYLRALTRQGVTTKTEDLEETQLRGFAQVWSTLTSHASSG